MVIRPLHKVTRMKYQKSYTHYELEAWLRREQRVAMLRKFLIPTVIVSILLLLTTLITIAKTEVTSVVTSTTATAASVTTPTKTQTTAATTTKIPKVAKATTTEKSTIPRQRKITIIHAQSANANRTRVTYQARRKNIQGNNNKNHVTIYSRSNSSRLPYTNRSYSKVKKNNSNNNNSAELLNNSEETTTSLLPLQPTLSVTSTTLASLIINQKQGQQHEEEQHQKDSQQQAKIKPRKNHQQQQQQQQQEQEQQLQAHQPEHQKRQNRQPIQDVTNATTATTTKTTQAPTTTKATRAVAKTQQSEKHLINVPPTESDRQPGQPQNKDIAKVELVTPLPGGITHAYIPFDLDYNDPAEEKARPPEVQKQSTINEVLSNLFPKGFTDIFRFSYAADPEVNDNKPIYNKPISPSPSPSPPSRVTTKAAPAPVYIPTTTTTTKASQAPINVIKSTPMPFKAISTEKTKDFVVKELLEIGAAIPFKPMPTSKPNKSMGINNSKSKQDANSDLIVVEKILANLSPSKSSEEFHDGSNSISKDELLRINRAAKQASVLPSMLLNPQDSKSTNKTDRQTKPQKAIVILNDNVTDDFLEAPEDDNQIAESQNIAQGVYHTPPPQSISYMQGQNHEINVHIVHDDPSTKSQTHELQKRNKEQNTGEESRNYQSYQSFVEQAKFLQNSLEEAPSRKFLKTFNPSLSRGSNTVPVSKGNFDYEQKPESHIQTVPNAAQLQYVLFQNSPQQHQIQQEQQSHNTEQNNQQSNAQSNNHNVHEEYYNNQDHSGHNQNKDNNADQLHYIIQIPNYQPTGDEVKYQSAHVVSKLHTHITNSNHLSDKDAYHTVQTENEEQPQPVTPVNLVFVTINTPGPEGENSHSPQLKTTRKALFEESASKTQMSPSQYVHEALNAEREKIPDHQPEESENSPKPSHETGSPNEGGYTFVEIQKSINIHNKLITEKDGRLVEQHETIYPPPPKYGERTHPPQEYHQISYQPQPEPQNYVSLSKNPIHVESLEQHEQAESLQHVQHALDPSQSLVDISSIQQSNLVQESHIVEHPVHEAEHAKGLQQHYPVQEQFNQEAHIQQRPEPPHEEQHIHPHHEEQQQHHHHHHHHLEQQHNLEHHLPEPSQNPDQPPVQIPYALPYRHHNPFYNPHYPHPLIMQEVIEKHVHIPYAVPEPYPVPVQHFIDRPVAVETIVEKPVPYAVEKVVEKVVEKHVPVEVEKIVEKPVEKIVEKYVDRPVAIPIKIPVALQINSQNSPYAPYFPTTFGGNSGPSHLGGPWSQQPPTLQRIPAKVLQAYYNKMLKKLVPQMTQAYKTSTLASKPKLVPKHTPRPSATTTSMKIGDMRFDLKPPPPPALGSSWDVGARYHYDYNTLPVDLSASSSTSVGKQSAERPGPVVKQNFDEFLRWRNGHSLKRSPELGTNLHMEYGFKPPLVPSVEIDDKGIPLKAASDLTKGRDE